MLVDTSSPLGLVTWEHTVYLKVYVSGSWHPSTVAQLALQMQTVVLVTAEQECQTGAVWVTAEQACQTGFKGAPLQTITIPAHGDVKTSKTGSTFLPGEQGLGRRALLPHSNQQKLLL